MTGSVKPVLNGHSKGRPKIGFQDRLSLNAGQEHSTMLSNFFKLLFVIRIFVLSILSGRLRQVLLYMMLRLQKMQLMTFSNFVCLKKHLDIIYDS